MIAGSVFGIRSAPAAGALGVEDAGQEALAPVDGAAPRPRDELADRVDVRAALRRGIAASARSQPPANGTRSVSTPEHAQVSLRAPSASRSTSARRKRCTARSSRPGRGVVVGAEVAVAADHPAEIAAAVVSVLDGAGEAPGADGSSLSVRCGRAARPASRRSRASSRGRSGSGGRRSRPSSVPSSRVTRYAGLTVDHARAPRSSRSGGSAPRGRAVDRVARPGGRRSAASGRPPAGSACPAPHAVGAGMGAAPVRVDRPLERQPGGARDAVRARISCGSRGSACPAPPERRSDG